MSGVEIKRLTISRGTAARWTSANPVLLSGEPALETDTRKTKMGDGVHAWKDLPYSPSHEEIAAARTGAGTDAQTKVDAAKAAAIATAAADATTKADAAKAAAISSAVATAATDAQTKANSAQAAAIAAAATDAQTKANAESSRARAAEGAIRDLSDPIFNTNLTAAISSAAANTTLSVTDNGDGTSTIVAPGITDNNDGTITLA